MLLSGNKPRVEKGGPTFDSKARGEFFVLFSIFEHFSLSFFDKLKGKTCYKIVCD